jgi:hypothetical protein
MGETQDPRPFASHLIVYHNGVRRAEDHDGERLGLHLWCVGLEAKSRPSVPQRVVEPPPAGDKPKDAGQINVDCIAVIG